MGDEGAVELKTHYKPGYKIPLRLLSFRIGIDRGLLTNGLRHLDFHLFIAIYSSQK